MTTVIMEITRIEALHVRQLVAQFVELLGESTRDDPAVARLTPVAYPDDPEAAREFRSLTADDMLRRRADDAGVVIADLAVAGDDGDPAELTTADAVAELTIVLDQEHTGSWLRTLGAVRLVLASRLGIESESDGDEDDPRFGVYEWLGYRLDALVRAADAS